MLTDWSERLWGSTDLQHAREAVATKVLGQDAGGRRDVGVRLLRMLGSYYRFLAAKFATRSELLHGIVAGTALLVIAVFSELMPDEDPFALPDAVYLLLVIPLSLAVPMSPSHFIEQSDDTPDRFHRRVGQAIETL